MLGFYRLGASALHRLHPLTKLAAAALIVVAAYTVPGLLTPLALYGLVLLFAFVGGGARPFLRTSLRALLPLTLSLFIIQGLLFPPADATPLPLGPFTLRREGLEFALLTSTRLLAFVSALLLLFQTTHPADLIHALTERGLPRSLGYVLLVSFQLLPYMQRRAEAIIEAQRSRGLETQGNPLRTARGLVPLAGPLVIGALSEVEERAIAIELRAFQAAGPKTTLRVLRDTTAQRVARVALLLLCVGLIGWRVARLWL
jgi:energy-coupling factor transport system permease protein